MAGKSLEPPKLSDLNTGTTTKKPNEDQFKAAVIEQTNVAKETVRRTFSLERFYSNYIDTIATNMAQEQGKPVSASQAIRAIIKRDIERAGR